jgi:hypothetical protein
MNGITHYDIKHSNILYYKRFNQKKILHDFGECEKFDEPLNFQETQSKELGGTACYVSEIERKMHLRSD